ncbi:hypothetical protein DdX_11533 [Ditylenchus destructor]|uniref:DUF5667 domain-containing protein n=1 Tax=Ditylenchus destructor TaxID=166010 RepID=A0AAD4MW58_9BILA|nr:hypothetical protein DdX_11533 [Ditylenchus destructor]
MKLDFGHLRLILLLYYILLHINLSSATENKPAEDNAAQLAELPMAKINDKNVKKQARTAKPRNVMGNFYRQLESHISTVVEFSHMIVLAGERHTEKPKIDASKARGHFNELKALFIKDEEKKAIEEKKSFEIGFVELRAVARRLLEKGRHLEAEQKRYEQENRSEFRKKIKKIMPKFTDALKRTRKFMTRMSHFGKKYSKLNSKGNKKETELNPEKDAKQPGTA